MGRPAGWMQKLTGRGAMRSPGAPSLRREIERRFWEQIATGITSRMPLGSTDHPRRVRVFAPTDGKDGNYPGRP